MGENQKYFFEFGEYQLDPVERRLLRNGETIALTPKAFETLRVLVENSGRLLGKDRLMEMLWTDAFVEEGNLADNISKIRQALGDSRKEPRFIETVSGRGYRFTAEVRRVEAEALQEIPSDGRSTERQPESSGNFALDETKKTQTGESETSLEIASSSLAPIGIRIVWAVNMLMPAPSIGRTLVHAFASRVGNSSGPATAGLDPAAPRSIRG